MTQRERLLIIGAGPKAAAICAKCSVLRDLGHRPPRPIVFERKKAGAHWTGDHGFTTGRLLLGTAPEKDVGFPYLPHPDNSKVAPELYRRYSWSAFQISEGGGLSDWIDRGRPHPTHEEWSEYVAWVIEHSMSDLRKRHRRSEPREDFGETDGFVKGEVVAIDLHDNRWKITVTKGGQNQDYEGEKLLVTGPGKVKCLRCVDDALKASGLILFGDNFWTADNLDAIDKSSRAVANDPIVIVGGGETAASITAYLAERDHKVLILTRSGTIFSRGEGYFENRVYSGISHWGDIPEVARREIIRRTDRGVFSPGVIAKLASARNLEHRFCEVTNVELRQPNLLMINGGIRCRLLIIAMGFDPLSFRKMIKPRNNGLLEALDQEPLTITQDLSAQLPDDHPKLYLPMLAGFDQGPGFPNLSCLGLMSDRILGG
jgi:mycobactin lysine-N-oxygenase